MALQFHCKSDCSTQKRKIHSPKTCARLTLYIRRVFPVHARHRDPFSVLSKTLGLLLWVWKEIAGTVYQNNECMPGLGYWARASSERKKKDCECEKVRCGDKDI
jgi:hypothetical protein